MSAAAKFSMRETTVAPEPYRWVVGVLLGVGVLVNYFDRVNLSVSHDALVHSFGITPAVFGQLSAAYSWTYALCQIPTGVLLDTLGVRRITLASVLIWAVASVAAAISPGVLFFFAARLLLGVGEAPTFPANAKAVGAWFPQEERSLATAVFDSAAKFANAIGVPALGLLLLQVGWRWSFGFTALLSLGYMGLFALLYREPLRLTMSYAGPAIAMKSMADDVPPFPLGQLLTDRKVLGLAIGSGAYNYVFYLLLTWLPTYLSQSLGISLHDSFLFTGVPWVVAGFSGLLIGGLLVDVLIQRGFDSSRVRKTVLIVGTLCGLGIVAAANAHTPWKALVPITIAIGGLSAASPVIWSLPTLLVPNSSTGRVGGIVNFSNQISAIVAPIATGLTVQYTHGYVWAFGIATAYLVVGVLSYVFLLGRIEPLQRETF